MSQERLVGIREASRLLNVGVSTLRYWESVGKMESLRTKGGHRRYRLNDIERLQGLVNSQNDNVTAVYCRVSSHDQKKKGDLERQKGRVLSFCVDKEFDVKYVYEEVSSGMLDTRNKLSALFKLAENRKINRVVVEHKDRLTRFMFNIFKVFFSSYAVEIVWVEDTLPKSYEAELVEDILSLLASFSAKIYGKRSGERRKKSENNS